jgi:D-3-phosphoglycerate dehydrogenase
VSKHRVAVFNEIAARGLERFPHARYIVGRDFRIPTRSCLRSHVLDAADVPPSVKAIARAGAGVNNIPVEAMSQRGVRYSTRRAPTPTR